LYIYLLTPHCTVLLEKVADFRLVKKFPTFFRTRRFITALTRVRHVSLSKVPTFRNMQQFYGEELSTLRPTPQLGNHPFSAVLDCLFNISASTLHIGSPSSIRNLRTRHAVVTGTHLSRNVIVYNTDVYWTVHHCGN